MKQYGTGREQGFTLVVALVLLIMVTLIVVMSFNLSQSNLKVVNNLQHRTEALNASQQAIGVVLHTPDFIASPATPVPVTQQCGLGANKFCADLNGDGSTDYEVTITATCKRVAAKLNNEVNLASEEVNCLVGQGQNQGVEGGVGGDSLCAETTWEISGKADDQSSPVTVTANQGVSVLISRDDADTACL